MRQVAPPANPSGKIEDERLIGARLGNYRLEKLIGHGNRSAVYQAKDITTWQTVAVRVIDGDLSADRAFVGRFRQEIARAKAVEHPNILPILAQGEEEGRNYIARPFLDTGSLRDYLGQPMPIGKAIALFHPIAEALDFAHARGLVHGDLKPGNILFDEAAKPLIADFGTAQALPGSNSFVATARGEHVGTPEYVSPEQGRGAPFDKRADLYAFGVMLYEALSGQPPFRAESAADTPRALVMQHVSTPPPPASSYYGEIGPATDRILLRALAKRPEERYSSATALCAALAKVEEIAFVSPATPFSDDTAGTIAAPESVDVTYIPRRQIQSQHRRQYIMIALGILVVVLLSLAFLLLR